GLVGVGLVAHIPEDLVLGRLEDGVERHGDLAGAEVGPEVAADLADGLDDVLADLLGDLLELVLGERAQVFGAVDAIQELGHEVRVTMKSVICSSSCVSSPLAVAWANAERALPCDSAASSRACSNPNSLT